LIEGEDSPTTIKTKRAADQHSTQPPKGLDEAEFENRLWMAEFKLHSMSKPIKMGKAEFYIGIFEI
jgi:hypothetical protein